MENFNQVIDSWITDIERHDFTRLCAQPAPDSWSLGQVSMHLLEETNYYLEQIKICASNNDNALEEMSHDAKIMFLNNNFPDERIEGPPTNANTPQPDSKERLMRAFLHLKAEMNNLGELISKSPFKGKTKHPGLNYFNAMEWLQFAEMHFRHHLRQKQRIADFLENQQVKST